MVKRAASSDVSRIDGALRNKIIMCLAHKSIPIQWLGRARVPRIHSSQNELPHNYNIHSVRQHSVEIKASRNCPRYDARRSGYDFIGHVIGRVNPCLIMPAGYGPVHIVAGSSWKIIRQATWQRLIQRGGGERRKASLWRNGEPHAPIYRSFFLYLWGTQRHFTNVLTNERFSPL